MTTEKLVLQFLDDLTEVLENLFDSGDHADLPTLSQLDGQVERFRSLYTTDGEAGDRLRITVEYALVHAYLRKASQMAEAHDFPEDDFTVFLGEHSKPISELVEKNWGKLDIASIVEYQRRSTSLDGDEKISLLYNMFLAICEGVLREEADHLNSHIQLPHDRRPPRKEKTTSGGLEESLGKMFGDGGSMGNLLNNFMNNPAMTRMTERLAATVENDPDIVNKLLSGGGLGDNPELAALAEEMKDELGPSVEELTAALPPPPATPKKKTPAKKR